MNEKNISYEAPRMPKLTPDELRVYIGSLIDNSLLDTTVISDVLSAIANEVKGMYQIHLLDRS